MGNEGLVTIHFSQSRYRLLREVLEMRGPEFLSALCGETDAVISATQRRRIQELLGDELIATGLQKDDEPNQRGLALEELIDLFSSYGVDPQPDVSS